MTNLSTVEGVASVISCVVAVSAVLGASLVPWKTAKRQLQVTIETTEKQLALSREIAKNQLAAQLEIANRQLIPPMRQA